MYAPERQQEILRLARDGGRVDVLSLAEEFQVTAETVRRDLKTLDRAGLLRRVHGGAIPAGRLDFEPDLAERECDRRRREGPHRAAAARRTPRRRQRDPRRGQHGRPARRGHPARRRPHRRHPRAAGRRPARRPPRHRSSTSSAAVSGTVPAPPSTPGRCARTARSAPTSSSSPPTASPPSDGLTTPDLAEAAVKRADDRCRPPGRAPRRLRQVRPGTLRALRRPRATSTC